MNGRPPTIAASAVRDPDRGILHACRALRSGLASHEAAIRPPGRAQAGRLDPSPPKSGICGSQTASNPLR